MRTKGGVSEVTDGPFVEIKEIVAGYYVVECEGMDRATQIAGKLGELIAGDAGLDAVLNVSGAQPLGQRHQMHPEIGGDLLERDTRTATASDSQAISSTPSPTSSTTDPDSASATGHHAKPCTDETDKHDDDSRRSLETAPIQRTGLQLLQLLEHRISHPRNQVG